MEDGGGTIIAFIFVYYYIPETLGTVVSIITCVACLISCTGRSLEEINMMMELSVPTRAWSQYQAGVLDSNGRPIPIEEYQAEAQVKQKARFQPGPTEFIEHASDSNEKVDDSVRT